MEDTAICVKFSSVMNGSITNYPDVAIVGFKAIVGDNNGFVTSLCFDTNISERMMFERVIKECDSKLSIDDLKIFEMGTYSSGNRYSFKGVISNDIYKLSIVNFAEPRRYVITTMCSNTDLGLLESYFLNTCRLQNELVNLNKKFNDLYDMVIHHPTLGTIPAELKKDFDDKKNQLKYKN